ncbi:protein SRG1-like [Rhodamnia argentea]|uniref:Protein SRG1-like n=1 Tax=Rhodamnia argentea TaxID=178133 RepID=A0A8B8P5K2_9MYRT|nr:protein SRG1-like [Rhodamnia argentea]
MRKVRRGISDGGGNREEAKMEEDGVNLNWSLPVPSVQELVRQQRPDVVPPRYLRDDMVLADHRRESSQGLPCIDLGKLMDPPSRSTELHNLHSACHQWGLFRLVNHGVSDEGLRMMQENVQGFFELPYHEKQKSAQRPGSLEGYGHAFVTSHDQKLGWNDMIFLKCLPNHERNLDLWPQNPPEFRIALEKYSEDMRKLAVAVVNYIGMASGIHEGELDLLMKSFGEGKFEIRMNYYPACPEPERVIGLEPHADISGITLLTECADMPGLQVLSNDDCWVTVPPVHGSIIVNLGQIMEIYSNGTYKAPDHRAVVNKEKERLSIATFCYPSPSLPVGPSPQVLAATGLPPLYQTLSHSEYMQRFFNRKLDDAVPFIDTLKM